MTVVVDRERAKKHAERMYNGGRIFDRSNEDHLHAILANTRTEHLRATLEEFHLLTGKSFGDVVKQNESRLSFWYTYALTSIADFASKPDEYFASLLRKADERSLRRNIVWRAETD